MRGGTQKGICLLAMDKTGKAVATASSYLGNNPDSPHARDAFWGMLATSSERRGEKIAPLLGAQIIVSMWEKFDARGFITGIVAENADSGDGAITK